MRETNWHYFNDAEIQEFDDLLRCLTEFCQGHESAECRLIIVDAFRILMSPSDAEALADHVLAGGRARAFFQEKCGRAQTAERRSG